MVRKQIFKAYMVEDFDTLRINYINYRLYPEIFKIKKNPYKTYNKKMHSLHAKIIKIIDKNMAKLKLLYPNKTIAYVLLPAEDILNKTYFSAFTTFLSFSTGIVFTSNFNSI